MQSYLALADPLLFVLLKTIRRAFEPHPSLRWYISDEIAMYLYAYSAGLPALNIGTPELCIKVVMDNITDASRFKSVLKQLLLQGFQQENSSPDVIQMHYPLSSIHIEFCIMKKAEGNLIWMKNKKGKFTYPLLDPLKIMEEHEKEKLPLIEKKVEELKHNWMKAVVNALLIE